jgi:hypothetical protein
MRISEKSPDQTHRYRYKESRDKTSHLSHLLLKL